MDSQNPLDWYWENGLNMFEQWGNSRHIQELFTYWMGDSVVHMSFACFCWIPVLTFQDPLASLEGASCAVSFETDVMGPITVMSTETEQRNSRGSDHWIADSSLSNPYTWPQPSTINLYCLVYSRTLALAFKHHVYWKG